MSLQAETVLIGSLQKFSLEDGPGIRTTVFFKGCPLNCRWCHNPELINPRQQLIKSPNNCIGCGHCVETCPSGAISINRDIGVLIDQSKCKVCLKCARECYAQALRPVAKPMTMQQIVEVVAEDKGFYDNTGGGMTVSGGEVLTHADFVSCLIDEVGKLGINACVDTSGYGDPSKLMELVSKENVVHVLYDMKAFDNMVHQAYTGVSNELIIRNLRMLAHDDETRKKIIMRMPLIQGVNDTDNIIRSTGELYRELGIETVNLLTYHNLGIGKKRNLGGIQEEFQPPTEERLEQIRTYFEDEIHLHVEILGRV